MILDKLVAFSNRYGSDPSLVFAGGGNTSAKENGIMYVKGSGTQLATIRKEQFVKMDLSALRRIFDCSYPDSDDEREALVLKDLMEARAPGEGDKRPSVETMLHGIFEHTFVLHLHPALVNGLTCSVNGCKDARELFGDDVIWVDACKPGYILSKICFDEMTAFKAEFGKPADMILLQNHGIFIADDAVEGLEQKLSAVIEKLTSRLKRFPQTDVTLPDDSFGKKLAELCGGFWEHIGNGDAMAYSASYEAARPVLRPFTPDHIVYCKAYPLWLGADDSAVEKVNEYQNQFGFLPRIVIAEGKGIFALGDSEKQAHTAAMLYEDAVKIAVYSESFGGALPMTEALTDFIVNWEVESYRSKKNA